MGLPENGFFSIIMTELIFATNNYNKVREVQAMLDESWHLKTLKEAGIETDIPEPYDTLEENALAKSRFIFERNGENCFSEDTGLEVYSLNNAPGVYSARYAGEHGNDKENIRKLLNELSGKNDRAAQFRTVISLILGGEKFSFEGICKGRITESPKGDKGFGYDPVFIPEGSDRTFAEMEMMEKNKFSHRKKAVAELLNFLSTHNGKNQN